jgi:hypothetical protein
MANPNSYPFASVGTPLLSQEKLKGQQRVMKNTRKGMGESALKLSISNAYILKKKLQAVGKNYKYCCVI